MNDDRSLLAELAGEDPDHEDHRLEDEHLSDAADEDVPAAGRRRRRAGSATRSRRGAAPRERDHHGSRMRTLLPAALVLAVLLTLGVGGVAAYQWVSGNVQIGDESASDYPGPGSGEATIQIAQGDSGAVIGQKLQDAGVIKSRSTFTTLFANTPEASKITPGTYKLKKQMSAADALDLLLDPSSRAGKIVTIPEGMRMSDVLAKLSKDTGIPEEEFQKAAEDYTALGVPENPAKSAEGYLWPGQYDIQEGESAQEILTQMVSRMTSELDRLGVPPEDRHRILTLASIAEKEAKNPEDYGKVVRTIDNRLAGVGEAGGRPMNLQLDSTVAYANGHSNISTTPQERAIQSPYNTYANPGLPVGPISNPGEATITAAMNPPEGPWLYWVTVNTDTGETKFAATGAEHEQNVREWQQWAASHGKG